MAKTKILPSSGQPHPHDIIRLMLISNSRNPGGGFLDHCAYCIRDFLGPVDEVLFLPYALANYDEYYRIVRARFAQFGCTVTSLHQQTNRAKAIQNASSIFVGGGNTFRLLKALHDLGLLGPVQDRVLDGMPYIGSSAGANVACPTIQTTNDMPIFYPPSFDSLNLIPFNINPHYFDPPDNWEHMGESREQRIREFHEVNSQHVVGLREGAWLRIEGNKILVMGTTGARIFRKGLPPKNYPPGTLLDLLLDSR